MDIGGLLDTIDVAIDAARRCGLDTAPAVAVRTRIVERAGFPGDLYVLALAGGTGVGKSSLLNAIAGTNVSEAGARRPTTAAPVVWLPEARAAAARPLIEWLGGAAVRTRKSVAADSLAILDLPDLDSIAPDHAAQVDAVLPKVDAVLWISDPEKYQDAVLHDAYLRRWMRRLDRQALIVNKIDRLAAGDAERIREHLAVQLRREGLPTVPILLTSATTDVGQLRAWLAEGIEAKQVVIRQLAAAAHAAVLDLAVSAGVDAEQEPNPLIPVERRTAAADTATREILAVVDLAELERQAVAATRLAARPRGGGLVGALRTVIDRGSGLAGKRADPEGYLRRWRERGSLARAAQPIRDLVAAAMPALPAPARPGLASLADSATIVARLTEATDRAVAGTAGGFTPPSSRAWPIVGIAHLVATGAVAIGAVWLIALFAIGGRVETGVVELPLVGPMPVPAALVIGGTVAWYVLGRLLEAHAGWLGRRWAAGLRDRMSAEVQTVMAETALQPLEAYEAARHGLWRASRSAASFPDER